MVICQIVSPSTSLCILICLFNCSEGFDNDIVKVFRLKFVYSLSYFQFIMTLEMLKSDPAQNAIADNLDDDDDDMEMSILMNMREFKKIAMKMVQPWREVQRGRR